MKVCPKCGCMCDDNYIYCDSCGFDFTVIGKAPAEGAGGTGSNAAPGAEFELSEEKQPPVQNYFQQNTQPPLQGQYQQPLQNSYQQNNQTPLQNSCQQNTQPPIQNPYQQPSSNTFQNIQPRSQNTYQQPAQQMPSNIQPRPQSSYQIPDYHNSYRQSYSESQQNIIPHTNVMAIISLVCGILGIVTLCIKQMGDIRIIFPILAIIFGAISHNVIKKSNGRETGMGMSTAGLVLGIITISIIIIAVVVVLIWGLSFLSYYGGYGYSHGYNA